ncbi:uncharacterized protein M6B38_257990 [Iris pallida]|uniref:Uncharacterized protein n=1 Tax=Iris pallida TaxID=29817 RepID=A0AAX6IGJ5_IRIPA|nr:uncharacterized protein M6B38_257990 [Iris pallida]
MATEVLRPHDCLVRPVPSFRNPNPRPRKRREGSPRPPAKSHRQLQPATAMATAIATGHVTILRRGDPLLDANTKTTTTKKKKETERKKRTGGSDPAVPVVPRQIRLVAPAGDVYAGSACSMSPSPRKVPLPSFSRRREVDRSATEDLRRLLRLD